MQFVGSRHGCHGQNGVGAQKALCRLWFPMINLS